jgi:prepilin-type N-terminal cleavage/methylation domain-containing protein
MAVKRSRGFTLVELMIVVALLAILSSIAIVSYRRYLLRSRVSEAYGLLGLIRMRQESYRSEFSQYCDVSTSTHDANGGQMPAGTWPASAPGRTPADWYGGGGPPAEWNQLGVRPSGQVYFRYETVAGNPGRAPPWSALNYSSAPNQDAWWVAHAHGDLDGNGVQSTFEAFSLSSGIWVSPSESE